MEKMKQLEEMRLLESKKMGQLELDGMLSTCPNMNTEPTQRIDKELNVPTVNEEPNPTRRTTEKRKSNRTQRIAKKRNVSAKAVEGREQRPPDTERLDQISHFPEHSLIYTRCKNFGCRERTTIFCTKCKIHLCFVKGRNCFKAFHEK